MKPGVVCAVCCVALAAPAGAAAATWRVTNFGDAPPDTSEPGPPGSLRYILTRQAHAGDTIVLSPTSAVGLTRPLTVPQSLSGLTIKGPGALVDRSAVGAFRSGVSGGFALFVQAGGVTIDGVSFQDVPLVIGPGSAAQEHPQGITVRDALFTGHNGIVEVRWSEGTRLEENTFNSSQDQAIALDTTTGTTVSDNKLSNSGAIALGSIDDTGLAISQNKVNGGGRIQLASADASVVDNTVTGATGTGIYLPRGHGAITVRQNTVTGSGGTGIDAEGGGTVTLDANTVTGGKRAGVYFNLGAKGSVQGGTIKGNDGAGLIAGARTNVKVSRVAMGGNGGPGIDLSPLGVTSNGVKKPENGGIGYPDRLEWDPTDRRVHGDTCPGCVVEAFTLETGARAGNPKNGEGAGFAGSVTADGSGALVYPATGAIECADAKRLTFTATGAGTSEFSLDTVCLTGPRTSSVPAAKKNCTAGSTCTAAGSTCIGKGTRCTGPGSTCQAGATCTGAKSTCSGASTCTGAGSTCTDAAAKCTNTGLAAGPVTATASLRITYPTAPVEARADVTLTGSFRSFRVEFPTGAVVDEDRLLGPALPSGGTPPKATWLTLPISAAGRDAGVVYGGPGQAYAGQTPLVFTLVIGLRAPLPANAKVNLYVQDASGAERGPFAVRMQ